MEFLFFFPLLRKKSWLLSHPAHSRLLTPAKLHLPGAPPLSGHKAPSPGCPGAAERWGLGRAGHKDTLSFFPGCCCCWKKQLLQLCNDKCTGAGDLPKGTGPRWERKTGKRSCRASEGDGHRHLASPTQRQPFPWGIQQALGRSMTGIFPVFWAELFLAFDF